MLAKGQCGSCGIVLADISLENCIECNEGMCRECAKMCATCESILCEVCSFHCNSCHEPICHECGVEYQNSIDVRMNMYCEDCYTDVLDNKVLQKQNDHSPAHKKS